MLIVSYCFNLYNYGFEGGVYLFDTSDPNIQDGHYRPMNSGKLIFSQLIDFLPWTSFDRCVQRYRGNHKIESFRFSAQIHTMTFAQLTHRESLCDIETCLHAQANQTLPHGHSQRNLAQCPKPMPIRYETGASTPTLHSTSFTPHAACA